MQHSAAFKLRVRPPYPRRPRTHLIHNPQIVSKLKSAAKSPPSPHRSDESAFPAPPSPSGK